MQKKFACLVFFAFLLHAVSAFAHKASDSYLRLEVADNLIQGQWDISLRDLDMLVGLDADGNGEITWGELKARHQDIASYALARMNISSGTQSCQLKVDQQLVDEHSDGAYSVLMLSGQCPATIKELRIDYKLLFDVDLQHKGLLKLVHQQRTYTGVFSPENSVQTITMSQLDGVRQFFDYIEFGIWHIWTGYDHILFLVSLLLPAVLVRKDKQWQAAASLKLALIDILKIVTAFTLAHSITLCAAALGYVTLPSRLVESCIALSVILAALNNIYPVMKGKRWLVAFAFGLIHGFGFASVLADLELPENVLLSALVAFNVGVELGQFAIVAVLVPAMYSIRKTAFYSRFVITAGSVMIIICASIWLGERALDVKWNVLSDLLSIFGK